MSKKPQEYYKLYQEASQLDSNRFDDYTELLAYYEMQEASLPKNKTIKPWVININTPYAADAINLRTASFFSKDYMGELEPLSPLDVQKIDLLNQVYHNFWKEMELDNHVNSAINRSMVLREAYTHIIFDDKVIGGTNKKRKGQLLAYSIDPASILIDPNALNFKDAEYIIVTDRITDKEINRKYGEQENISENSSSSYQPSERGEIYIGKDYNTNQNNIKTRLTFYEKTAEDTINKIVLIEQDIVEEMELPIKVFPIAQLRFEKKTKSPYGLSLMDRLLPLQKSINAIESATTTAALAFASPSYAVRRDSGVNPKAVAALAGSPGVVFTVIGDPATAIVPISNAKIDNNLISIKQENREELYRIAGISEEFLGKFGSSGNTSGGSHEASSRSQIIEHRFFNNLEEYIEDLTMILIEFITKAFDGETIFARGVKSAEGEYEFKEFSITEDMKELDFAFSINMDVKSPYAKENAKNLITELYQIERQYDAPVKVINVLDILKNYNLPNAQEYIQRYKDLTKKDEQMKAEVITQWVTLCYKNGVDANLIQQGIIELMAGKETPTVDEVFAMIEQQMQQMQQMEVSAQGQQMKAEQQADGRLQQQQVQMLEQQALQQEEGMQEQMQGVNDEMLGNTTFDIAE